MGFLWNNKYKENLNLFDMPKSLKDAKIKDIYTDDSKCFVKKWI